MLMRLPAGLNVTDVMRARISARPRPPDHAVSSVKTSGLCRFAQENPAPSSWTATRTRPPSTPHERVMQHPPDSQTP